MNILVLGKGKTGGLVAEVAQQRGHTVTAWGESENPAGSALSAQSLQPFDAVIDFTTPTAVLENIRACAAAGKNIVVGTTGWYGELTYVHHLAESSGIGFLYGSNFSIGVNIFFEIAHTASFAVKLGYAAKISERHHTEKKDAPSGTAVTLQKILGAGIDPPPEITSIREGDTVGTHVMFLDSAFDSMMLVHDAKSRMGFAEGAVRGAEWLQGKKGFFEFKDIFRELK
ncbi:MAG TPA: dihydrodipicolinate reductase C-terminal domain-containing protein [Terriglobales bacterium]|nr:dihydrodipicolinate reductase C-terminal domain-containing protein [Terriglobales bacterium]